MNENVLLAGAAGYGLPGSHLHLESFPPKDRWGHKEDQRLQEVSQARPRGQLAHGSSRRGGAGACSLM